MEKETPVSEYGAKFLAEMEAKYAALGAAIASVRAALNITGGIDVIYCDQYGQQCCCTLSAWRKWAETADIVKRAD